MNWLLLLVSLFLPMVQQRIQPYMQQAPAVQQSQVIQCNGQWYTQHNGYWYVWVQNGWVPCQYQGGGA